MRLKRIVTEICARDLKVAYGDFVALECADLSVSGNTIAVVGHNGAGKSTLIKTILRLLNPAAGRLELRALEDGTRTALVPEKHMAFCPETGAVFADISVEAYVRMWCRIKHADPGYYTRQGRPVIELLEVEPLLHKLGRELSKGQCRRVQTAIGFLTRPKLFLFDEPFDGLDVQKTSELADIIRARSEEMCFIISSHRMDVVERIADLVIVLKEGRIVSCGSVERVCQDLCRRSVIIGNLADQEKALSALRARYARSVINRMGSRVVMTGAEFEIEDLERLIRELDRNGAQIESVRPSLVDAVNYHLRNA